MSHARNVYREPKTRLVVRTEDVYQVDTEEGTTGYSETLLSIVANFTNSGTLDECNARSMVGKSKRGEVAVRLSAVVDPSSQRILKVRFKAHGCLAMIASASVISTLIEGSTFEDALSITPEDVRAALDGVPSDKIHTLYFAVESVRALICDFLINQGASLEDLDATVPCDTGSISCILCEHCSSRDSRLELRFLQNSPSRSESDVTTQ